VSGRAVVLIDHGSREPGAGAALEELAGLLRASLPDRRIVTAHLEAAPPSLEDALASAAADGAHEVIVLPCFLAVGRHVGQDLPRRVRALRERFRGVSLRLAEPLGAHPALVTALLDRLRQADLTN
jgi:sirohydrochlorin cobaltochelatase